MFRSFRKVATWAIVLFVATVYFVYSNRDTQQHGETARIVRVIDGDSYVVVFEGREQQVRAIGIDAPEGSTGAIANRGEGKTPSQAATEVEMGALSAEHAASLLPAGANVQLVFDPANASNDHRDRYGRLLAFIYQQDVREHQQRSVNELMVFDGYAQALTRFRFDERMKETLTSAEKRAKKANAGIWGLHPDVFE